jgi:hypothetical protein
MSDPEKIRFLTLSTKGLANIPWNNYERNFKFKVGAAEYCCPSFIAELLSPHVSSLRQLQTLDCEMYFENFLSLGFRSSVSVNFEEFSIFRSLCVALGATEFYEQLFEEFGGQITAQNVCDRLKDRDELKCLCEGEIGVAASHFTHLDLTIIENLNVSLLSQILKHDSLQVRSEDWLCEIILGQISKDGSLLELVSYE